MPHPRRKKQTVEGLCNRSDRSGPPPSQAGEPTEPTQPLSSGRHKTANSDFSPPLGLGQDTNDDHMDAGTGLSLGGPGINPVEGEDLRDAEENSELTSGKAMIYPAADDSDDPDWIPARMRKKAKPTGGDNEETSQTPYKRGPDVMSKSERTQRRYRKAWQGQKRLDDFFAKNPTIPCKHSPSDDGSGGDDGMETARRCNP